MKEAEVTATGIHTNYALELEKVLSGLFKEAKIPARIEVTERYSSPGGVLFRVVPDATTYYGGGVGE